MTGSMVRKLGLILFFLFRMLFISTDVEILSSLKCMGIEDLSVSLTEVDGTRADSVDASLILSFPGVATGFQWVDYDLESGFQLWSEGANLHHEGFMLVAS